MLILCGTALPQFLTMPIGLMLVGGAVDDAAAS